MIPAFADTGYLPPGVHPATLEEIEARFGRESEVRLAQMESIRWLENFLSRFEGTVIVVSHDRYFLNQVCTHIADIDFGKIQMYVGGPDEPHASAV